MRIALIDYGAGNLRSAARAFAEAGAFPEIITEPGALRRAEAIVVPGVGAFGPAMARLHAARLVDPIRDAARVGTPLVGICLGMQLLFDESDEGGHTAGFGLLPGVVRRLPAGVKIPHMGWNTLQTRPSEPLFEGLPDPPFVYFVHSYVALPADSGHVVAETTYGVRFASAVRHGNVFGLQFHPEKSSRTGARLLRNMVAAITAERTRA